MPCLRPRCANGSAIVRNARSTHLNFLSHASSTLFTSSFSTESRRRFSHAHAATNVFATKCAQRKGVVTSKIRRLHPTLLPSLIPVIPTPRQFRRDFGPPSIALDRILVSLLLLGVLHLFPASRLLTVAKLLALMWPMLHPLLTGSRRNAQLRFSANQSLPLIVAGKLQVRSTSRGTVARVSDGSDVSAYPKPLLTTSHAADLVGKHACSLVVGGKIVDIVVGSTYLAPYPCIRRRVLNEACAALYAEI